MVTKGKKLNRILIFITILLTYPLFEFLTPLNLSGRVDRATLSSEVESLSTASWFDQRFQESVMTYMNDNIGLFPFFVQVHNQAEYSLFGNIYTGNVVAGKENYLFEQGYLDAHFGKDYIGIEKIEALGAQLQLLQDTLATMDKFLFYCFATGKATYYPEYLPYDEDRDSTNFEYFIRDFEARGIKHINSSPWFLDMKDSLGHLLYPQYGIHWSHYASVLMTDSIVNYIEGNTGWDLPELEINSLDYSEETKFYDNDIAHSMNLFSKLEPDKAMIYPEFEWKGSQQSDKKLLIIGDSFTWDLFENLRLGTDCFAEVEFWFYNQTVHREQDESKDDLPLLTRHLNLHDVIQDYDAFMVLTNEPNSPFRSWGFVKDALNTLKNPEYRGTERNNGYLRETSHSRKQWRNSLTKMAEERNISLDSMINIYLHDRNFKPKRP